MAVSTSSGGSASTFLAVLRRCKRRGGASSAAAGRRDATARHAAAQRCRLRTMVVSRCSIGSIDAAFARLLGSSCSGVWCCGAHSWQNAQRCWELEQAIHERTAGWMDGLVCICAFSTELCGCPASPPPPNGGRRVVAEHVHIALTATDGQKAKKRPAAATGPQGPGSPTTGVSPAYGAYDRIETRAAAEAGKRQREIRPVVFHKSDLAEDEPTTPRPVERMRDLRPAGQLHGLWSRPSGRPWRREASEVSPCSAGRGATTYNP